MSSKLVRNTVLSALCMAMLTVSAQVAAQDSKPATQPHDDDQGAMVYVMMETSMGNILLELNREKAPIGVKNFLSYVDKEFYDGTIFHRVISNFVIQGGGFTEDMQKKPTDAPIKNEWQNGLKNKRGMICYARTTNPDSATSQFFINVADNANLDQPISGGAGYAVFGKVVVGMDVVDKIRVVPTTVAGRMRDVPAEPIVVKKARHLKTAQAKEYLDDDDDDHDDDVDDDDDDDDDG